MLTENELRTKRTAKKERRKRRAKELEKMLREAPADVQLEYATVRSEFHEVRMAVGHAMLTNLLARAEDVAEEKRKKRVESSL